MPLKQCVTLVKDLYLLFFRNNIPVIRMGLQACDDLEKDAVILAGPYHPAFGHLVFSEVFLEMALCILKSDPAFDPPPESASRKPLVIHVHPRSISKMRGLGNHNIRILQKTFGIAAVDVAGDISLAADMLRIGEKKIDIRYLAQLKNEKRGRKNLRKQHRVPL